MPLLDEFGHNLIKGPAVKLGLDKKLDAAANVFEGIVTVKIYLDAIEGKGSCSHCGGPIEGVLRFPKGYTLMNCEDAHERQADAKRQLYDKLKRLHFCRPRIEGPKRDREEWLKQFQ